MRGRMMQRTDFCLLMATALVLALPLTGAAQVLYGSIVGNVRDATGAVVPGATVTILHKDTNQTRQTTANAAGVYTFSTVLTGAYKLTTTAPGFTNSTRDDIQVAINNVTRVDATLNVGPVSESVTVTGEGAAVLQTDRAEVRAEIERKTIENIPIPAPDRNYQALFEMLPGFSEPNQAHSIPSNPSRAMTFNVNGASRSSNNTRVDGASSTNIWLPHMTAYIPAAEAIQVVNVVAGSFDAEQGLAGGAAINVQIKSGTNSVHGSAFEYHNSNALKAYPYFSDRTQRIPKLVYNQFGGTLGGPIKRDKLFYFVSYEGTRHRAFVSRYADIPTPAMRAGDLSDSTRPIYDPLTGKADGSGRIAFPNNRIPEARWDPVVKKILPLWPDPTVAGTLSRNYLATAGYQFDRNTVDTKVNWNVNSKLSTFARVSFLSFDQNAETTFGDQLGGRYIAGGNPGHGFGASVSTTLAATYVFTPRLVMDAYFGYTLMDSNSEQALLDQKIGLDVLGIPGTNGSRRFEGGWPHFEIDGFERIGMIEGYMPYYRHDPQTQYVSNFNYSKGSHNIRFGFEIYSQALNHTQPELTGGYGNAPGSFRFGTGSTQIKGGPSGNDYNAFASFLLGTTRTIGKITQVPDEYQTRTGMYSLYLRDQWQVNRKLTLTYGTRWEYFPMPTRGDRGMEMYNPDTNKMQLCGVGSIPTNCGVNMSRLDFAPRVGLAYRVTDTWVVRAGYGITNDPYNLARPLRTNYPVLFKYTKDRPNSLSYASLLKDGIPAVGPIATSGGILDLPNEAVLKYISAKDFPRGYIQTWNLTVEKQLPKGFLAGVAYVGSRSVNQLSEYDQNYGLVGGGQASRIFNKKFGRTADTIDVRPVGTQKYDSLQARIEKRFSSGFQVSSNLTWGKSLGWADVVDSDNAPRIKIPEYFFLNYGRTRIDQRLAFHFAGTFELPFGRGKPFAQNGWAAKLLGGWQVNGLLSLRSGTPFSVTGDSTSLNAPGSTQRADVLKTPQFLGGPDEYYDKTAFSSVPTTDPRFGTAAFNLLDSPGTSNVNASLFRSFTIHEGINLQFRAEALNLTNTPHFSAPQSSQTSSSFMRISSVRGTGREGVDERAFRLAVRLTF